MKSKQATKKFWPYIVGAVVTVLLLVGMYLNYQPQDLYVTYPAFLEAMEENNIKSVQIGEGTRFTFEKLGDDTTYQTDNPRTEGFKEMLLTHNIKVEEMNTEEQMLLIQYIFSATIFIGVFAIVFSSVKKGGASGSAMALQVAPVQPEDLKVGFSEIAGNVEVKEQVQDMIDFMKEPQKYADLGARMPKGMIFYGPPGTGKTLMAKAIAKEAGVPFFSVSGSDFVQMYVGVGAGRIRDLFKEARKHEKAVIFIDEIDAIGKKRSQNPNSSNDEKDQTLNALLTEMSGFDKADGIVVIAATNRLELLDDALLRPGRFDRHIEIGYPDKNAREQIIKLYLKDKPVDESVEVAKLLTQTAYFTGAMLENLLNEAAILAANENEKTIQWHHIDKAFYIVIAGQEKKDRSHITDEERRITAYHEAGHALITKLVAPENSVTKVTIIPTVKGAGGFSMNVPKDKMYQTKKDFKNQIQISLAGRVAEEMIFGDEMITTGASNDIEKASQYLRDYVGKYGMHSEVGLLNLQVLMGQEVGTREQLLATYQEMMHDFYKQTKELMKNNQEKLHKLAQALLEEETLDESAIEVLVGA